MFNSIYHTLLVLTRKGKTQFQHKKLVVYRIKYFTKLARKFKIRDAHIDTAHTQIYLNWVEG